MSIQRIDYHESFNVKSDALQVAGSSILEALSIIAAIGGILCLVLHPQGGVIHDMAHFITEKGAKAFIGVGVSIAVINGLALLYLGSCLHEKIKDSKKESDKCFHDASVIKICESLLKERNLEEGTFLDSDLKNSNSKGFVLLYREIGKPKSKYLIFKEKVDLNNYLRDHLISYHMEGTVDSNSQDPLDTHLINELRNVNNNEVKPMIYDDRFIVAWKENDAIKYVLHGNYDIKVHLNYLKQLQSKRNFKINEDSQECKFSNNDRCYIDTDYSTSLNNHPVTESTYVLKDFDDKLYALKYKEDNIVCVRYFYTKEAREKALQNCDSRVNDSTIEELTKTEEIKSLYNKINTSQYTIIEKKCLDQNNNETDVYLGLYWYGRQEKIHISTNRDSVCNYMQNNFGDKKKFIDVEKTN